MDRTERLKELAQFQAKIDADLELVVMKRDAAKAEKKQGFEGRRVAKMARYDKEVLDDKLLKGEMKRQRRSGYKAQVSKSIPADEKIGMYGGRKNINGPTRFGKTVVWQDESVRMGERAARAHDDRGAEVIDAASESRRAWLEKQRERLQR